MATAIIFEDALTVRACEGLGEFRRWTRSGEFPDRGRIDWIAGRIEVDMSPENLFTHGTLKTELAAKIYGVIRDTDRGQVFVDRTRVVCPAADLSVEPDVVVTHAAIDAGRAAFVPASGQAGSFVEIESGPDLVVPVKRKRRPQQGRFPGLAGAPQKRRLPCWEIELQNPGKAFGHSGGFSIPVGPKWSVVRACRPVNNAAMLRRGSNFSAAMGRFRWAKT